LEHEQMRRQQILDAALACFSRRGYHATSMEDIVRESGLSVGALYSYFPSKEELFTALDDLCFRQSVQHLAELFRGAGTPLRRLERVLEFFFGALDERIGPWHRLRMEAWAQGETLHGVGDRERRRCDEMRALFRSLLREAVAAGECRPDLDAE